MQISEMSAGCICCSLVGDFHKALKDVQAQFHPDRILIEPSGVGKLSDVIVAVQNTADETDDMKLNSFRHRGGRHQGEGLHEELRRVLQQPDRGRRHHHPLPDPEDEPGEAGGRRGHAAGEERRRRHPHHPWDQLDGKTILAAIEKVSLADELLEKMRAEHAADEAEHEHAHHHHDHEHVHGEHEHHHDHDHHDHEEHEHHHDHDEHAHHHDHECDDPNCSCHHHHHHADEVFTSWGKETPKVFAQADIERILTALDSGDYGKILRAKGIVNGEGGKWIEFDFVPEEHEVRAGHPDYTGRLCVIGAELQEDKLSQLFGL